MASSVLRSVGFAAGLTIVSLLSHPCPSRAQDLPPIRVDRQELTSNLVAYRFGAVDAELSQFEQSAEKDPRQEMNAYVAFAAFATSQSLISGRLDDWVKASPNSYAAALARGERLVETALRWRGSLPIAKADPEGVQQATRCAREAMAELDRALTLKQDLALAYALRIKAARVGGLNDVMARVRNEGLAAAPSSFVVREEVMYSLRPRWGGSRAAMLDFVAASEPYARDNPTMRFLTAWPAIDQGDVLLDGGNLPGAIEQYTAAIKTGGEYWRAYARRAEAYAGAGNWEQAQADAARVDELCPQRGDILRLLTYIGIKLDEPAATLIWASDYLLYENPDPQMLAIASSAGAELKQQKVIN
ncbi:MAG TPA: DUF4034 domain-containing protein [Candidatus Binataceae bacterium]|nr:DUF4034 domain-containing protein [Candidatus Binataceae bacterium]